MNTVNWSHEGGRSSIEFRNICALTLRRVRALVGGTRQVVRVLSREHRSTPLRRRAAALILCCCSGLRLSARLKIRAIAIVIVSLVA